MKKLILILIAATTTLFGFAAGKGDGSTKSDAIEFDWENGNTQEAGTTKWYKVTVQDQLKVLENPNIALYLTNLSSSEATVTITALVGGGDEQREYPIKPNSTRVWNTSASMLKSMGDEEMYVSLYADQKIHLSAKLYEGTYADEACLKADPYDYTDHSLEKKGTNWYSIDAQKLRDNRQGLIITYSVKSYASKIVSMVSTNCPSTGLEGLKASIPNSSSPKVHEISPVLIQNMSESTIYLKVEHSKDVNVSTQIVTLPSDEEVDEKDKIDFSNPEAVEWDKQYEVKSEGKVFRVKLTDLIPTSDEDKTQKYMQPKVAFNNKDNGAETNVKVEIAFKNDEVNDYKTAVVITKNETINAGETGFMDFARNLIESLDATNCAYVYIRITPDNTIKATPRLRHMREGDACTAAKSVNWDEKITQEVLVDDESSNQWYAIDITGLKDKEHAKDVKVTVTNMGEATADVTAEVAFECPYIDLETVTRQVKPGESNQLVKVIKFSTIASLASNEIYVGLTTTQTLTVKVDTIDAEKKENPTCKSGEAIPFNWEEGHKQAANADVWYKVKVEDIQAAFGLDFIPEAIVTNEGDKTLTITGEVSSMCPDFYVNQIRSFTIGANDTYKKEIAKDLVKNLQGDEDGYLYVRLNGTRPFNFRLNKKVENEGANCTKAIPFNWTSGHNQDANTTLWYVIDLDTVKKAEGKKLTVFVNNLTKNEATIEGMLATECPCSSPQSQTLQLKGGDKKEKSIARSAFMAFGSKVYIRLTSTQKFHFEANLDSVAKTVNIPCPEGADLTEVKVKTDIKKPAGKDQHWYRVRPADLVDPELAPQITVTNGAVKQTIKASIAYDCPVKEEMMSRTQTFAAGQKVSKIIEQSIINQLVDNKIEYVYVYVEGNQDYEFRIDMVEPNTGYDCMHAIKIEPEKDKPFTNNQAAGKTLWYKLNVDKYLAMEPANKLTFSLTPTEGMTGTVQVVALTDCDGKEIFSATKTVGKGGVTKSVSVEVLNALRPSQWVYVKLTAQQAQTLLVTLDQRTTLDPEITACQEAVHFAINTDYNQNAGEEVWYSVNLKAIRENTSGDATLTVTNLSGAENSVTAEISLACPVKYEMTGKTVVLNATEPYTRIISRDQLNAVEGEDEVFIRVTSEKKMKFRVDMHMSKGDECSTPIEFDWENGNTNPQGACLWYNVPLYKDEKIDGRDTSVLRIPEGYDLQITIVNLSNEKAIASADLRFECKEASLGDRQHSIEGGDTLTRVIDRDLFIEYVKATSFVINLCTPTAAMYIRVDTIPEQATSEYHVYDTVAVCNGGIYEDIHTPIGGDFRHVIEAGSTLEWYDSLRVRVGTMMVDSFYHYKAIAKMPIDSVDFVYKDSTTYRLAMNESETMDSIAINKEDGIVAIVGQKLDMQKFGEYLERYYRNLMDTLDLKDSLADFDTIVWLAKTPDMSDYADPAEVQVLKDALTTDLKIVLFEYHLFDACQNEIIGTVEVNVTDTVKTDKPEDCTDTFTFPAGIPFNDSKAYCGLPYDQKAIQKWMVEQGVTGKVVIYFSENGGAFNQYKGELMDINKSYKFFASTDNACGDKVYSDTTDVKVIQPDAKGSMVATLPLVDPYNNGWLLIIDIKSINANDTLKMDLEQGRDDDLVAWYRMTDTSTTPDMDKDEKLEGRNGFYLTSLESENEPLPAGTYYAVIDYGATTDSDGCGGSYRTIIYNVKGSQPVGVRKQMINGKLYIITEDNVMYDAQGQKVQQ